MNWKPTEGLRRAVALTDELLAAGEACNIVIKGDGYPLYQQRMMTVLGAALDRALSDGSEVAAHEPMAGNGSAREFSHGLKEGDSVTLTGTPYDGDYTARSAEKPAPKKRGRPKGAKRKTREAKPEASAE